MAADSQHVYWANFRSIGRANLDGTGVDQNFIPNIDNNQGQAVAVDGQHVYWTAAGAGGDGRIGRESGRQRSRQRLHRASGLYAAGPGCR